MAEREPDRAGAGFVPAVARRTRPRRSGPGRSRRGSCRTTGCARAGPGTSSAAGRPARRRRSARRPARSPSPGRRTSIWSTAGTVVGPVMVDRRAGVHDHDRARVGRDDPADQLVLVAGKVHATRGRDPRTPSRRWCRRPRPPRRRRGGGDGPVEQSSGGGRRQPDLHARERTAAWRLGYSTTSSYRRAGVEVDGGRDLLAAQAEELVARAVADRLTPSRTTSPSSSTRARPACTSVTACAGRPSSGTSRPVARNENVVRRRRAPAAEEQQVAVEADASVHDRAGEVGPGEELDVDPACRPAARRRHRAAVRARRCRSPARRRSSRRSPSALAERLERCDAVVRRARLADPPPMMLRPLGVRARSTASVRDRRRGRMGSTPSFFSSTIASAAASRASARCSGTVDRSSASAAGRRAPRAGRRPRAGGAPRRRARASSTSPSSHRLGERRPVDAARSRHLEVEPGAGRRRLSTRARTSR